MRHRLPSVGDIGHHRRTGSGRACHNERRALDGNALESVAISASITGLNLAAMALSGTLDRYQFAAMTTASPSTTSVAGPVIRRRCGTDRGHDDTGPQRRDVALGATLSVSFSEAVSLADPWTTLSARPVQPPSRAAADRPAIR